MPAARSTRNRGRTSVPTGATSWSEIDDDRRGRVDRPGAPRRWHDGREVAIKVQYPGAADALLGDLQPDRPGGRGWPRCFPGIDVKPLVQDSRRGPPTSSTTASRPRLRRSPTPSWRPRDRRPRRGRLSERVLVTDWIDTQSSMASLITAARRRTRPLRRAPRSLPLRRPGPTGVLHADPHPGDFRIVRMPTVAWALACSTTARLPAYQPVAALRMGRLMRLAVDEDRRPARGSAPRGFIKDDVSVNPGRLRLPGALRRADPGRRFRFSREWMREQFDRVNNPAPRRSP